jgi:hypothetical protein
LAFLMSSLLLVVIMITLDQSVCILLCERLCHSTTSLMLLLQPYACIVF